MSRKLVLCALTVALLGFSVASSVQAANTVYFPVEAPSGISETWIYATNNSNTLQAVTTRFIPIFRDGTEGAGEGDTVHVAGGRTRVITDAVAPGSIGLLEVTSPGDVNVSARLTEVGAGEDDVPAGVVPTISSLTAAEGGDFQDLLGFQRLVSGRVVSDVRLINLSSEANGCQAQVFRGNGESPWGTVLLGELTPLTMVPFDDFLDALQELQGNNVRVRFECEGPFYAYGVIRERAGGPLTFVEPSTPIAQAGLLAPGDEPDGGGSGASACVDSDFCFERKGVFHTARRGDADEDLRMPVPPGDYRKLHVNVDVFNGGPPNLRTGGYSEQLVFWLAVTNHYNLYGFVRLRNPGPGFELSNTHGVRIPFEGKLKQTTGMNWPFGKTYNFDYVYDAANRSITLTVRNAQGNVVSRIQSSTNVSRVTMPSASHETFHLVFGYNEGRHNKHEYSSYGWKYSNLSVGFYR